METLTQKYQDYVKTLRPEVKGVWESVFKNLTQKEKDDLIFRRLIQQYLTKNKNLVKSNSKPISHALENLKFFMITEMEFPFFQYRDLNYLIKKISKYIKQELKLNPDDEDDEYTLASIWITSEFKANSNKYYTK